MTDPHFDSDRRLFLQRLAGAGVAVGLSGVYACTKAATPKPTAPTPATASPPVVGGRGRVGELETVLLKHASGASAEIVNEEIRTDLEQLASRTTPESNLRRIDAVFGAREQMLEFNVPPMLALESLMTALQVDS